MKRKIGELILIIFFYLLQVTLGRVIAIGGIKPNLLIILPVLFGFLHGKNEGMYVGFFAGFFYDLFFSGLFGFTSLVFVYIGYCSGIFYQKYEETEILPEVVYTLLIAVILYKPVTFLNKHLNPTDKRRISKVD